jgi:hypothetical protein
MSYTTFEQAERQAKERKAKLNPPMSEITLRDHFAGLAMQGMLANPKLEKQILERGKSWIEESAWIVADAMIKERNG